MSVISTVGISNESINGYVNPLEQEEKKKKGGGKGRRKRRREKEEEEEEEEKEKGKERRRMRRQRKGVRLIKRSWRLRVSTNLIRNEWYE